MAPVSGDGPTPGGGPPGFLLWGAPAPAVLEGLFSPGGRRGPVPGGGAFGAALLAKYGAGGPVIPPPLWLGFSPQPGGARRCRGWLIITCSTPTAAVRSPISGSSTWASSTSSVFRGTTAGS